MKKKGWKITALIIFSILLLQTFAFVKFISLGYKIQQKESDCSIICDDREDSLLYYFDSVDSVCYCTDIDGEIIYTEKSEVK